MSPLPEDENADEEQPQRNEVRFHPEGEDIGEEVEADQKTSAPSDSFQRPLQRGAERQSSRHQAFFHNMDLGFQPGEEGFDEDQAALPFVLNEWAGGTSIHGVANIADGLTWQWWKRALWLILVCCSGGIMVWQISALLKEFLRHDILMDTETVTPSSMTLPEITVCSLNYQSQAKMDATNISEPKNEGEVFEIATPLGDFIEYTNFNEDFFEDPTKVWSPIITHHGLCFQFNSTNKTIHRPGIYGGLFLQANLKQEDNPWWATSAGILLYAQQPGTQINDQLPFAVISPGSESIVTLQKQKFRREPDAPWSRCSQIRGYTQSTCRAACLFEEIRRQCGCREIGDFTYDNETMPVLDYCTSAEPCLSEVWENESEFLPSCPCSRPPCDEEKYKMTVNEIKLSIQEELYLQNISEPLHDYVALVVNYDEVTFDEVTESKAMSVAELLGAIGGSMGLFLGISALSVVEVFGDLLPLRLVPRMFGYRNIHGLGSRPSMS